MAQFFPQHQQPPYASSSSAQNLQFYPSSYSAVPVSGHSTPSQASYGGYGHAGASAYPVGQFGSAASGFGGAGVSGRIGEQGGLRTGWIAAFGTEGYEGEPPLLEELGVNFGHIKMKTLVVLNPLARIDQHIMDDSDLAGPVLFFLLFGFFLLFVSPAMSNPEPPTNSQQSGKLHFGYIYGVALLGSTSLHIILSLMSPPLSPQEASSSSSHHDHHGTTNSSHLSSTLTYPRSASVLGYCLLPFVLTSFVGILMPMDTALGYILTAAAIVWCTYSSSGMFCAVGRMRGMRGLVAYPLALFYAGFGLMSIFSSRGSGPGLGAKTAVVG